MSDVVRDAMIDSWRKVCRGLEVINGDVRETEQKLSMLLESRATAETQRSEFENFLNSTYPGWLETTTPQQSIPQEVIDRLEEETDMTGPEIDKWWTTPLSNRSRKETPQQLWKSNRQSAVRRAIREMDDF